MRAVNGWLAALLPPRADASSLPEWGTVDLTAGLPEGEEAGGFGMVDLGVDLVLDDDPDTDDRAV